MFINSYQAEWAYFTGAVVTLFFIIDPIAAVPIYMTITERFNEQDRRMIRRKASLIALGLLSFVAVSGSRFFALFNITLPAFQIAGGILLLNIGMAQLNAVRRRVQPAEEGESLHRDDISVFPLATPLLAGPGAISTVILLATRTGSVLRLGELIAAIATCMFGAFLTLRAGKYLQKILGTTGLNLLSRLMGILLTAVAVQFILNGIKEVLPLFKS